MRKTALLVKISNDESIGFDLFRQRLFIQKFEGHWFESGREDREFPETLMRSVIYAGFVVLSPILSNELSTLSGFSNLFRYPLFILSGVLTGWLFVYWLLERSKGKRDYRRIKKGEVMVALGNRSNIRWGFWIYLFCIFLITYSLYDGIQSGENPTLFEFLGGFGVSGIHFMAHPFRQMKAMRIINKQMKAGKFDE